MMQPAASTVSRRLLAKLRDVMAGGGSPQDRLDKVVRLIAADMVAEVCSCYIMRAGEVLELFATEGLKKSAVHQTRLRVGEGLVGDIAAHARPLALSDAQSHPNFAYRPETGEEIFHSLVGVPIVRSGRVIGVLVVQNRSQRHYTEEEVETLETVAMVLAELISSSELINREELAPVEGNALLPMRLEGTRFNGGVGIGVAVLHQPRIIIKRLVSDSPEAEMERLRQALATLRRNIEELFSSPDLAHAGDHADILETYRMFAEDKGWINRITEAIQGGLTAEAAVQKVHEDTRVRMSQVQDAYLRERLHDLEDLANRLLSHLADEAPPIRPEDMPDNTVLVCRTMGPTELLNYDRRKIRGLILEEGSPTMHVCIVARALDIPVVGRVKDMLTRIEAFDPVIVDGDNAQVLLRPSEDIQDAFSQSVTMRAQRMARYAALRDLPAATSDGELVRLYLNAGLLVDLPSLATTGADGIGLYRTEVPFMARPELPDVEAQTVLYRRIIEQAEGKPVVFRSLDVGGDKVLPYWNAHESEDNPALGWRSIRITLDRPAVLRHQLRALIRAAEGRELRIMFPMIAEVAELDRARALLDAELERHRAQGRSMPHAVKVGTMLEVPSLAFQMKALLKRVDFISVGSNDMTQFLFAVDRTNPRIADRYDSLSPAMLTFLRQIAAQCAEAGVSLSVCGEMAGRPLEAMALVALGIHNLSMSAPSVGPVKAMIRSMDAAAVRDYMLPLLDGADRSLRPKLRAFALDHGVVV